VRLFGRSVDGRWRRSLESEGIALLEGGDIVHRLHAIGAHHDQVALQHGNRFVDEFHERGRGLLTDGCVHCVLEDVRQLARNFVEERVAVGSTRAGNTVGGDVEALDVFVKRIRVLQDA
jgi:hypothetical protein